MSGPPSPGRAGEAQQDAARPGCHAAGAAQLEMQHIPAAACPPLPDTSCPELRALHSARGCSELSLVPSIQAGHDGWRGQEMLPAPLLGTLRIRGSAPAPIQPSAAGNAGSHPRQTFVQFSSFPCWLSLFPALPCSPWVPDPASPDRHSSPAGQGWKKANQLFRLVFIPRRKAALAPPELEDIPDPGSVNTAQRSSVDEQSQNRGSLAHSRLPSLSRAALHV